MVNNTSPHMLPRVTCIWPGRGTLALFFLNIHQNSQELPASVSLSLIQLQQMKTASHYLFCKKGFHNKMHTARGWFCYGVFCVLFVFNLHFFFQHKLNTNTTTQIYLFNKNYLQITNRNTGI